jgi:HAD superfamily hydrolase (TIGR01549 family)
VSPPPRGTPVKAVLLDYGLTLVTHTRPTEALHRAYTRIARGLPRRPDGRPWSPEELLVAIHDRVDDRVRANEKAMALHEIDIAAAHRDAYAALGVALDPEQIDHAMRLEQEAWWEGVQVASDTVATLVTLRQAGLRLGICSNAAYRAPSMLAQLDHVGLLPLVDSAVFSSEVGWRKPAPQIFAAALAALDAEATTTVMVGDTVAADVDGAHAAGMRAVLLREHRRDPDPAAHADAVLDRLADLPALLETAGI